jgi:hypothetical protein
MLIAVVKLHIDTSLFSWHFFFLLKTLTFALKGISLAMLVE